MQNESPSFRYIFKAVFFVVLSLLLIGAAIGVGWFFLVTVPKRAEAARIAERERCESNLKSLKLIVLGSWALDHDFQYPFNVPRSKGGTLELCGRDTNGVDTNVLAHFLVMSNVIGERPYALICPAVEAYPYWTNVTASNVYHLHTARSGPAEKYSGHILAYCPKHRLALLSDGEVHSEWNEGRAEAEAVKEERETAEKDQEKQRDRELKAAKENPDFLQGLPESNKSSRDLETSLEASRVDSEASLAKLKIAREWTFKAGAKRKAKFAGMRDANTALFDFSEGYDINPDQSYEVPLQNLSVFDQKVVRKAAEN